MSYAVNWDTAEQRITAHKSFLLDAPQKMDAQRLQFLMDTYEECKGESVFRIRAKLLENVLVNKDIFLDGNVIVGTIGGAPAAV